jgi:hypothetical protein
LYLKKLTRLKRIDENIAKNINIEKQKKYIKFKNNGLDTSAKYNNTTKLETVANNAPH